MSGPPRPARRRPARRLRDCWLDAWPRWRRRALVAGVALIAVSGIGYGVAFALTFSDRVAQVPDALWRSHDLGAVMAATHESPDARSDRLWRALELQHAPSSGPLARYAAPPHVYRSAERWVSTLNTAAPEAILWFDSDSLATLYIVPGAWWGMLDRAHQEFWVDQYGTRWRTYVAQAFGDWDHSEGFYPGLVVLDTAGEVVRNMNGKIVFKR